MVAHRRLWNLADQPGRG